MRDRRPAARSGHSAPRRGPAGVSRETNRTGESSLIAVAREAPTNETSHFPAVLSPLLRPTRATYVSRKTKPPPPTRPTRTITRPPDPPAPVSTLLVQYQRYCTLHHLSRPSRNPPPRATRTALPPVVSKAHTSRLVSSPRSSPRRAASHHSVHSRLPPRRGESSLLPAVLSPTRRPRRGH